MGLRGPPPKPTKLRLLEGNPSKRPINGREPQPIGRPEKPDFISGAAAEEWDRAVAALPWLYSSADVPTLTVYVVAWVTYRNALAQVAREGSFTTGSMGQKVSHPCLGIASTQAEIILRAADRLGMSPIARSRLAEHGPPQPSKFDGLLGTPRSGPEQPDHVFRHDGPCPGGSR